MPQSTQSHLLSGDLPFFPLKLRTPRHSLSVSSLHNRPPIQRNDLAQRTRFQAPLSSPGRGAALVTFCSSGDEQSTDIAVQRQKEKTRNGRLDLAASILLFGFWVGIMYYIFNLAPDQTPVRDIYFLLKLLFLKRDDGFQMNKVVVALWCIMGMWPLLYSILLVPCGRSSRSRIPVWPFLVLSCFGGAYALIPYFALWKPPPPAVNEDEIKRFPVNFLELKLTAVVLLATGSGLILYAGLAGGDVWKELYQYFGESKFIHVTCIDFLLFTAFAPFWVYNDMAARKWTNRGSWLLPLALVPFMGPALYILLRPSLSPPPAALSSSKRGSIPRNKARVIRLLKL